MYIMGESNMTSLPGYVCDPREIEVHAFLNKPHYVGVEFKCYGKVIFTDTIKTKFSKPKTRDDIHLCIVTACTAIVNMYGFEEERFYEFVQDDYYLLVKNVVENLRTVRAKTGKLIWQRK